MWAEFTSVAVAVARSPSPTARGCASSPLSAHARERGWNAIGRHHRRGRRAGGFELRLASADATAWNAWSSIGPSFQGPSCAPAGSPPRCFATSQLQPDEYPLSFLTFDALRLSFKGLGVTFKTVQHSIRRVEFDAWLLRRSGAPVATHNVRQIRRDGDWYVLDDAYRCRRLVGAGGTRCPVHRAFFRDVAPRDEALQAAVLEEEFAYDWDDGTCRLWFFERGLPGYSWYVPKAGGHLNVGIGAMAQKLKSRKDTIRPHWQRLTEELATKDLVRERTWDAGGYTYYLRPRQDVVRRDEAFLVGDFGRPVDPRPVRGHRPGRALGPARGRRDRVGRYLLAGQGPRPLCQAEPRAARPRLGLLRSRLTART